MAICHVVVAEKDEGESKRGVWGAGGVKSTHSMNVVSFTTRLNSTPYLPAMEWDSENDKIEASS